VVCMYGCVCVCVCVFCDRLSYNSIKIWLLDCSCILWYRYDENIEKRKNDRNALTAELLTKAFQVMDPNETGRVSRESIMLVFYILNEDFVSTHADYDVFVWFVKLCRWSNPSSTKKMTARDSETVQRRSESYLWVPW
jgi:hypothetical protein